MPITGDERPSVRQPLLVNRLETNTFCTLGSTLCISELYDVNRGLGQITVEQYAFEPTLYAVQMYRCIDDKQLLNTFVRLKNSVHLMVGLSPSARRQELDIISLRDNVINIFWGFDYFN